MIKPDSLKLLDLLRRVDQVRFKVRALDVRTGDGVGRVVSQSPRPDTVIVRESGRWRPGGGGELAFTNVYRWTTLDEGAVSLEHLRHGDENPVFLGTLVHDMDDRWSSSSAYLCVDDLYLATVRSHASSVRLMWTVAGPKKNYCIESCYEVSAEADSERLFDR